MKILVTGASGFVGRSLVSSLASDGFQGIATGRAAPSGLPAGWEGRARHAVLSSRWTEPPPVAIVHLEVKQHIDRPSKKDAAEFAEVNVGGTRQWLEWAARHEVARFVFASSIKAVQPNARQIDEAAPAERNDPYGRSKAEAEAAVAAWCLARLQRSATILRFVPIYGPGNEANLAAFARQVCAGKPCMIGSGSARKAVVSLANAVAAIRHVLCLPAVGLSIFNVADRSTPTVCELAELIATAAHAPRPRRIPWAAALIAAKLGDLIAASLGREFPMTTRRFRTLTTDTMVSSAKLIATGFSPPQSTKDGIAEMARWIADDLQCSQE